MDYAFSNDDWLSLLTLIASVVVALLVHWISFAIIKASRLFKRNAYVQTWCRQLYSPVRLLLVIVAVSIVYPGLHENIRSPIFSHIISILFIISISWLLIKAVKAGRVIIMRRYDLTASDNIRARKAYTQFHMIENILIFLIIVITIGIVLMTFQTVREVGVSLLTSAGIAGIILGFAAQKLIATVLAGIQLAITQPMRIDDVVIVEGEWGKIEEITLTYVVVKIWDERRLVLPTTYFIEKPFQNWTRTNSRILGTVFIHADYTIPFEEIRSELTRLLESSSLWDKRVNVLQVTDASGSSVEMRALVSASDSSRAWDLRVYIREKLLQFIQEKYPESLPRSRVKLEEN